jgi:ketosteroid isomerase-like protein
VATEHATSEVAIRNIFERWAASVRAEDIYGIRANHSPDILMFDVPPPLSSRGLDAYMDTWKLFYKSQVIPVIFNFEDVEITAGQDVAFVTALGRCVYIP